MTIHVNRVLNMKHIKAIGFDMDHTLVKYDSEKFEKLAFYETIKKLIQDYKYPKEIANFKYQFNQAVRGLVIDQENGNLIKVSLYNKIKTAYHGTKILNYRQQQKLYGSSSVDLREETYRSLDTNFSIAHALVYSLLVDYKDSNPDNPNIPDYITIANNVRDAVDIAHRDGSLKDQVIGRLDEFVLRQEAVVQVLERFKKYGKKLWIITNSDYTYSRKLLDYTINPFLKEHKKWQDLFEITITLASKPRFFTDKMPLLKVNEKYGSLDNFDEKIVPGIYQGGYAVKLQNDLGLEGDEILYLGDHIYGDILKLKKACDWRTALVIEELEYEVKAYKSTKSISIEIDRLMESKVALEKSIDDLYAQEFEFGQKVERKQVTDKFDEIEKIDKELAKHIKNYESHFNPFWGEVMRAGVEPSFFAEQIERYACIYMTDISDFNDYNPRAYFRPKKRKMAHEM